MLSSLHGNPTDNDVTMQDVYKVGVVVALWVGLIWSVVMFVAGVQ